MNKEYNKILIKFSNIHQIVTLSNYFAGMKNTYFVQKAHSVTNKIRANSIMGLFSLNLSEPIYLIFSKEKTKNEVLELLRKENICICKEE